jgi:methyl halide transferase
LTINTPFYWENRYQNDDTGWDMKTISPPLQSYIDQLKDKHQKILIPGAGNAYEAEYLFNNGFKNIYVADIAKTPLKNFKARIPYFPDKHLLSIDFFDIEDSFDLILEQTFFCALPPNLRPKYAEKMHQLLKPKAKLAGLFFDFPFTDNGPPFGGNAKEYKIYFENFFHLETLERCYNSYPKRQDKELFFEFIKK